MKNDYKIGLVIGLLVLLLGVGYFIFRGPSKGKKTEAPITTIETTESDTSFSGEPTATDSSAGGSFTPPPPSVAAEPAPAPAAPAETVAVAPATPAPTAPAADTVTVAPAPAKPADASLSERVGNWSTRTGNENAAPAATDTVAPRLGTEGTSEVAPVKPATSTPAPATDAGGEWGVPPVGGSVTPTNTPATTETPATYTVQPNDVGWYIAESVYGKGMGRYWSIIQAANPTVNSSNMKAGQVLKIPPLPDSARARAQETAARGTMLTDDAGQRIYVTKSGDSLWTIAQNVYGKGHLYKEIQKANPKVDTNYLRPGLRLVIPEVAGAAPTAADAADSTATFGSETVTSVPSSTNNYYIVKSGDSLWTIAEKEYGDGNYSDIIKKANPNINPNNIRVGQKLVLPAKPEAGTTPVTNNGGGSSVEANDPNDPNATEDTPRERRPSRRSSGSESVPSDEPDFGL